MFQSENTFCYRATPGDCFWMYFVLLKTRSFELIFLRVLPLFWLQFLESNYKYSRKWWISKNFLTHLVVNNNNEVYCLMFSSWFWLIVYNNDFFNARTILYNSKMKVLSLSTAFTTLLHFLYIVFYTAVDSSK